MSRFLFPFWVLAGVSLLAVGCRQEVKTPPIPVPEVVLAEVEIRDVQEYLETDGFADAFEFVEIPARVTGFLQQRRYTPGEIVQAGAPLFLVEQALYLAEVQSAEAERDSAKAQLLLDDANLARTRQLVVDKALTEQDLETDQAKRDESAAAVKRAEANLATAKLNLSYTDVRSPITGKVKENLIDIGNLVGPQTENEILTTVAGMDPIYIYFDISDYTFNRIRDFAVKNNDPEVERLSKQIHALKRKNRAPGSVSEGVDNATEIDSEFMSSALPNVPSANDKPVADKPAEDKFAEDKPANDQPANADAPVIHLSGLRGEVKKENILVEVALLKGAEPHKREYPFKGLVDTTDNVLNRETGTIKVRGVVPNPEYLIFPNQVCYVRIPAEITRDALLIEEQAILVDMNKHYVFVVDEQNRALRRGVTLGKLQSDGMRIIEKGVEKGERYILAGGQKVRNHGEVKPVASAKLAAKPTSSDQAAPRENVPLQEQASTPQSENGEKPAEPASSAK